MLTRIKKIHAPRITLDRFGQIIFIMREISRIAFKINPTFFLGVIFLNIVIGLLVIPSLYLEKQLIDSLIRSIGTTNIDLALKTLMILISLNTIIILFRIILERVEAFMSRMLARFFSSRLNLLMARKLAELDLATIEDPEFRDRFGKIERESGRRAWNLILPLSSIPGTLTSLVSALAILIGFSPFLALCVIIFSLPRVFNNSRYIKKWYELTNSMMPTEKIIGWLSYFLIRNRNFMELKLLGLPEYLSDKMGNLQDDVTRRELKLRKQWEFANFWSFVPMTTFDAVAAIWLAYLTILTRITVGSFQLYTSALRRAQGEFRALVSAFLDMYENYLYVVDLVWFLNLTPLMKLDNSGHRFDGTLGIKIEFQDVWFRYRKGQKWIVKGVNFTINPTENIALVGVNGAGKSTIIKLLCRFYDPQKGKILVNGTDLKELNLHQWRSHLAVLFQEFETYPFSAREAIGYGDVSRIHHLEEIKSAAKLTDIHDFIDSLDLKYENPLDPQFEKGVRPSIGQWQRIGISRMLFRQNAHVFIMDEPTSNVDPEAEEKIFSELVRKTHDKSLLFVTQRFSTVRLADRIFVLEKGKLIESGTHSELMKKRAGKYKSLFLLQAKGYQ